MLTSAWAAFARQNSPGPPVFTELIAWPSPLPATPGAANPVGDFQEVSVRAGFPLWFP